MSAAHLIYHIPDEPPSFDADDSYVPASLEREGFIHATRDRDELLNVAARFYGDRTRCTVWLIDRDRVDVPIRDEPGADRPEIFFPHVFGPLPRASIIAHATIARDYTGAWRWMIPPRYAK